MDKQRVKIKDIAARIGVSPATVSLALNHRPGVSQQMVDRIVQEARTLGYQAKQSSPKASKKHLKTLSMIVKAQAGDPPQSNLFYSNVIYGIEDACARRHINLLFATLPVDENNRVLTAPPVLYTDTADGFLMVGAFIDETVISVSGILSVPIILVDAYSDTEVFDMVISDNFGAAYQAVEYLIHQGHAQIAMVGGEGDAYPSLRERRRGYTQAMHDHGCSQLNFVNFNIQTSKPAAFEETSRFLLEHPQVTALFGINDSVAVAAMRAAQSLGKRIPQDLSVIGFDDTFLAVNSIPMLTTMRVDTVAMGRAAVQMLSFRLENPKVARMTLTIHPTLVERESVCPPSASPAG